MQIWNIFDKDTGQTKYLVSSFAKLLLIHPRRFQYVGEIGRKSLDQNDFLFHFYFLDVKNVQV